MITKDLSHTNKETIIRSLHTALEHPVTRKIYIILLRKEKVGVREIQRKLKLSSPSVASYHLTKLLELEIVNKLADNTFSLTEICRNPGWLPMNIQAEFFVFKHLLIPKFILMIVFLSTSVFLASFALIIGLDLNLIILYLIFTILVAIILLIRDVIMNYLKTGMLSRQDEK